MPNKTEEYLALACKTADSFSRKWEHWAEFLITAARLYKYSYPDQLMIYAQRPDATACAEYDVWNNKMNRYVRRGSKGIALLDESGGYPRLHYVFDVSDTAPRRNALYPDLWQINESLKEPVRSMLAENYGVHSESFGQQLADVAGKLVHSYWDNNSSDILGIVDGSYLMSYDDAGRELQFKSAAAMGVTYMLLERCGLDPAGWFDEKDFQAVYDFTTPSAVYALGTAVSDCSREVLRQIERTVKTTIRRRNIERSQEEYEQQSELHEDRGLFSAEPNLESAPEAAEPVRKDAPELSDGATPGGVQHDAAERDPVPAPVGGGTDGREQDAAADERTVGEEPGSGQGEKTDGVGAAHEQPESAGGGNDPDRADLQLSFLEAAIPTEAQQIESIDQAESEKSSSAFVLSQSRMYERLSSTATALRNGLIALADQTFPAIDQAFGHAIKNADGHEKWVNFFSIYWHRDCVLRLSIEKFTESYRKWCLRRNYKFRTNTAHKLYALAQDAVPTLPKNNGTKALVLQACKSLNAVCEAKQATQEEMNRLASLLPEYEVVMQMEGTGPITGPALMAEIGDVRRFKNKKALVAFAGIDAPPFQSGNFESKSRHVSKRGSPHLRRTVFLVANIILTLSHKDNSVFCFMDKKRAEGKHYYVYTIAGSAKFLRIYYARVTEYLRTQEKPVAAGCPNGNS